ncbi:MAG: YHS domain-containing protein [Bacteroidota bacterium]
MKHIFSILSISILFGACTFTTKTNEEKMDHSTSSKQEIKLSSLSDKKDHVCGMSLSEGHIADTMNYNGHVYGFCSSTCKEEFIKDPEANLKK